MNIFFTADLHLYHKNIIRHCNRPWEDTKEMNEALVDNWNGVVKSPKDKVYVLGDFIWKGRLDTINRHIDKLNGKVYMIEGNHDSRSIWNANFRWIDRLRDIKIDGQKITLCHYPMKSWRAKAHGAYHLHGHTHGNILNREWHSIDVGVDAWGYTPANWEDIREVLKND